MIDYKRAIEILEELQILIKDEKLFEECEIERVENLNIIQEIAEDNPQKSFFEIQNYVFEEFHKNPDLMYIMFNDKKYIIKLPSLNILIYIFKCSEFDGQITINKESIVFFDICIDFAKKYVDIVKIKNDKIRSLLSELSKIAH